MIDTNDTLWIVSQFEGINLGDKRLNSRAEIIASNMIENPEESIPNQSNGWAETKAAYRFFDSKRISFHKLIQPHIDKTKNDINGRDVILAIQDTCYITYSHHPSVNGLSRTGGGGNSKKGEGIILHNTIAVDPTESSPTIIGIFDQYIHNRNENINKDADWNETMLWIEASQRIHMPNSNTLIIEVMDREGDVFDIMQNCLELGHNYIIRSAHDRITANSSENKLFDFVRAIAPSGTIELVVRKKPGQTPRKAVLTVAFSKVILYGPKQRKNETIECNVVYVVEKDPPQNQEPLEWILLTSLNVDSFDDAYKIIRWYKCRWIIEEYHKCIKSGCKVEEKQFKEELRIENFLGIANIVAMRLLQLRDLARLEPYISARKVIEPLKVEIIMKYNKIKKKRLQSMNITGY